MRLLFTILFLLMSAVTLDAQPSQVQPGDDGSIRVDGSPFFPLGWNTVGTCTPTSAPNLYTTNRDSAAAHLNTMRAYGLNTILEPGSADGRIVARAERAGWYNWYNYSSFKGDESLAAGHVRPGAYVEGLRWLMDEAMSDPDQPIRTIVALTAFVKPGYERGDARPHSADDVLTCGDYRAFIDQERREVDSGVPAVICDEAPASLPFWEWNLWYVVTNLRDHPGLLGWYAMDEPEGGTYRHFFGIVPPGEDVPRYEGPESLPTPDLLRYVYRRVKTFERHGRSDNYPTHPVIIDIAETNVFFSNRFEWSTEGSLNPRYSSGPFDRTPDGGYHVPIDILGLEASANIVHTGAVGDLGTQAWYWDPNYITRDADMLMDVASREDVWGVMNVAAQAQLPSSGPFAATEPLRCEPNDQFRVRPLNDRDLIWQLLAPAALGVRGHVYYSHALMPSEGEGAEQVRRSNQLLEQFRSASLDDVVMAPALEDVEVGTVTVRALTDYHRRAPASVGETGSPDAYGLQATASARVSSAQYRVENFGRTSDEAQYAAPAINPPSTTHAQHRLLQVAMHRYQNDDYLLISNSYDARIEIPVQRPSAGGSLREGVFDLSEGGSFSWVATPSGVVEEGRTLRVQLEPYEARVFRIGR